LYREVLQHQLTEASEEEERVVFHPNSATNVSQPSLSIVLECHRDSMQF
jgi:hypothetical protein